MNHLSRQQLGKRGEEAAVSYLLQHGYKILDRNFKARYGEIDIIAGIDKTVVFIEVKTRSDDSFGIPEEAVTPKKLHEVVKTSEYYIHLHPELPQELRIDVIGILIRDKKITYLNHIKNVTM